MANTQYEAIAQLTTEEIVEQVAEAKEQLGKMRFNHAVSPIEDGTVIKKLKRKIAKMMTELRKRELAESK